MNKERLADYSAKDSESWDYKRNLTQSVEQIFYEDEHVTLNKQSKRLRECSSLLLYSQKSDNTIKLARASFCKVRSCPVCNWRRSRMWQQRMFKALPELTDFRWLLLTLTVKNCEIQDLKNTISTMQKAWSKLRRRKFFGQKIVGYVKSLEITRSESGQAHPHFHVMLLVQPSYFNGQNYMTKNQWSDEWQSVLDVDYQPVCDIRAITDKRGKGLGGAVLEVLKYEMKSAELLQYPDFLKQLALQLKGTRAIELGGLIKEKLNAKDGEETDEQLLSENEDKEELEEVAQLVFSWSRFNKFYKLIERSSE